MAPRGDDLADDLRDGDSGCWIAGWSTAEVDEKATTVGIDPIECPPAASRAPRPAPVRPRQRLRRRRHVDTRGWMLALLLACGAVLIIGSDARWRPVRAGAAAPSEAVPARIPPPGDARPMRAAPPASADGANCRTASGASAVRHAAPRSPAAQGGAGSAGDRPRAFDVP